MGKYEGTQTEKNLQAAFSGESGARNKYTYFASVAKKEGYEQISAMFLKTAENEREHAKICMKDLQRQQRKKAFRSWQRNSAWLERLKSSMKSVIVRC